MNKVEIMKKREEMMKKFDFFPKTLTEMHQFIESKQLNYIYEEKNEVLLKTIISKINNNIPLTNEEINFIHLLLDLGDTCGCDTDHRIRTYKEIKGDDRFVYTER